MPRVSIIMPLYNGKRFIRESIESILAQTFTDWEFLIINELGSDDGCAFIVKKYAQKDSRIKLIQNDVKLGLAASLNVGLDLAIGEYVARVDVDDPSYPERLEKQVEFLDSNLDVTLCGTLKMNVTPSSKGVQYVSTEQMDLFTDMIFGNDITHGSVMFRRNVFNEKGYRYNPDYLSEDFELWTRINRVEKIVNLPEVLVHYRWGFGNISISKGEELREESRQIVCRNLENLFGIQLDYENKKYLLAPWRSEPKKEINGEYSEFLKETFLLLHDIEFANQTRNVLTKVLMDKLFFKRFNWSFDVCELKYDKKIDEYFEAEQILSPKISVVIPIYNGYKNLRECLDSIVKQTYRNFEVLLINEFGSDDSSAEICEFYCKYDKRFRLIQNEEKLGLAESLNLGIRQSQGEYIARMDADDICHESRLEKQLAYMEKNRKVGICGTYQRKFGRENWLHDPPVKSEQIKANLLFYCDLCHSTLMLRKSTIVDNSLFYNSEYLAEDFELWCRAVNCTEFYTVPDELVLKRVSDQETTTKKSATLLLENNQLVAQSLKNNLGIELKQYQVQLMNGLVNPFYDNVSKEFRENALTELKSILIEIYEKNNINHFYDEKSLLRILSSKWNWAKYNGNWHELKDVSSINDVFFEKREKNNNALSKLKCKVKEAILPRLKSIFNLISEYSIINKFVERWTWERYNRTKRELSSIESKINMLSIESSYNKNKNLNDFEKIKVSFLFQIPSFWPSWETFYYACKEDSNFDVDIVLLETNKEPTQMYGAKSFLESENLNYTNYSDYDFVPGQIVVIQSPYDKWHRHEENYSETFKRQGIKVVYVTYGIEISDTDESRKLHFKESVLEHSWRIYTFSDLMRNDYKHYCRNHLAVRSLGHPKFDCYFKQKKELSNELKEIIQKRKIVLFKLHFPKYMKIKSEKKLITIPISEYQQFTKFIKERNDIFFVCQFHPKFFDYDKSATTKLLNQLSHCENVYTDKDDDYRTSLMNADYIIVDRSAVMVEAGAVGVPVLYLSNPDYYEPMTKSVEPLVDSYYQGNSCQDMIDFIEMCVDKEEDPRKEKRESAFRECVPYFDGKCGERIKDDIIISLEKERKFNHTETLMRLEEKIDGLENTLKKLLSEKWDEV